MRVLHAMSFFCGGGGIIALLYAHRDTCITLGLFWRRLAMPSNSAGFEFQEVRRFAASYQLLFSIKFDCRRTVPLAGCPDTDAADADDSK